MRPAVIFDIDGTLADCRHRRHHVIGNKKNYDAFFQECDRDTVIEPVRTLIDVLYSTHNILLVSGRSAVVANKTIQWLADNRIPYHRLYMRVEGDYRSDVIIKREILKQIKEDGYEVKFTVDDRDSVVKMWREEGLTCFQCAEWTEHESPAKVGFLTLMIGPSGAGKSTWLKKYKNPQHIISSDQIRHDLYGDSLIQEHNVTVFGVLHDVVKTRINNGLPCIVDATNIRRKDRLSIVKLAKGNPVEYIIINRPLEEKYKTADWRSKELIDKHEQTFNSQIKDIIKGDGLSNVNVRDMRGIL